MSSLSSVGSTAHRREAARQSRRHRAMSMMSGVVATTLLWSPSVRRRTPSAPSACVPRGVLVPGGGRSAVVVRNAAARPVVRLPGLACRRARGVAARAVGEAEANLTPSSLAVALDNKADPETTTVTLSGQDKEGLLATLMSAFGAMGIHVVDANVSTDRESGMVRDTFRVTDRDGSQLDEADFPAVREHIYACLASRNSGPANIISAAKALRAGSKLQLSPFLSQQAGGQGAVTGTNADSKRTQVGVEEAEKLEKAAIELAQAAAALVETEKKIVEQMNVAMSAAETGGADLAAEETILDTMEKQRSEVAAVVERKMAALEAAIAGRRNPKATVEELLKAQKEKAFMESMGQSQQGTGGVGTGPAAGNGYEIILQAFNWESHKERPGWYRKLISDAKIIAAQGYTALWLPPPTNSVSPQGYLPRDLYDLNSAYGSETDLRELLSVLRELRLKSIADIVINHRCAHYQKDGKWNQFGGRLAWDETAICCDNPAFGGRGARGTGDDYPAAPNIDHTNPKVRQDIVDWLKYLRNIGFDGWRFDYVKGYSGEFTRKYIDATVPLMAFGEYWDSCNYTGGVLDYNQESHRQRLVNWCDKTGGTSAAFDFTTKGILQEAVGRCEYWRLVDAQGRPPGMIGMWNSRAVTFIENHDTGSTLGHWPFPPNELAQGYAYILTHPGTPCIFWDHTLQSELGPIIQKLIDVRKRTKINAKSSVVVQKATNDLYSAVIDGKLVMKIGPGSWSPNTFKVLNKQWERVAEGRNMAVWLEKAP